MRASPCLIVSHFEPEIRDIRSIGHEGSEFDGITVFPIPDLQASEPYVGGADIIAEPVLCDSGQTHPLQVRENHQLILSVSADIHHCDGCKLLKSFGEDFPGIVAEPGEILALREREVDEKRRNVPGIRFEDAGPGDVREGRHRAVDLFVGLDENIVHPRPGIEGHPDGRIPVAGKGGDVPERTDLHQALPERFHDSLVHLPGRKFRCRHFDRQDRHVYLRNQGDRQFSDADRTEDGDDQ